MRNLKLISDVLNNIKENPDHHWQAEWGVKTECGTTHCVAGWACEMSGHPLAWDGLCASDYTVSGLHVPVLAQELMGLTDDEANRLFFETNEQEAVELLEKILKLEEHK